MLRRLSHWRVLAVVLIACLVAWLFVLPASAAEQQYPQDPIPEITPEPVPDPAAPMDVFGEELPIPADKAKVPMDDIPLIYQQDGVRVLHLHSLHTGETIQIAYWKDGEYLPEALKKLNYFLRDHRTGDVTQMDPKTFDIVWRLYNDLEVTGPVHIISGFRSARTNAMLKSIGRNVAKKSQHVLGTAMDIRFPNKDLREMRDTALSYQAGGVGYYPGSNFIHVDTGRVRQW